ncbi:hypothetical protein [Bdellovibrio sp. HCB337]|uniref:hypothetical protein n=1 Tax=Bdellovibrio sp. HCB337 TaxID=3394358 RepID=UPI0039A75A45
MKDNDLDILLAEYRNKSATDLQVQKWKRAVRAELKTRIAPPKTVWVQLAAACLVGFVMGALLFRTEQLQHSFEKIAQKNNDDATIEYVFSKSN